MTSKLLLLTICLLACTSTFADRKAEIEDFAKGFLRGIASDPVFDNIKACLADSETFISDVATAIKLIQTKDPAKVKQGIVLLGQAVQIIPDAARACQASEADIAKLIALAKSFSDPTSFLYHVGKSLLINRVEVLHEVNSAIAAYYSQDWYTLGFWVGKAMDTIILGYNRPLRPEFSAFLNSIQNSFTSGEIPEKFRGLTLAQIKARFLGTLTDDSEAEGYNVYDYEGAETANDLPTEFDSSLQWPGCVHPIRDQGHCGSCWAFAASEVLSDRFCVASNRTISVILSPQYLVSCDSTDLGCGGGVPLVAWKFLQTNGIVTDGCWPYASYNGSTPSCSSFTKCANGQPLKKYYAADGSVTQLYNPTSIKQSLVQHGPVHASFTVYEDFISYNGGIYKHTSGTVLGRHSVKIIGWGNENGQEYWLVANSWGLSWGINGFFKIAFGDSGIDSLVTIGQADLTRLNQTRRSPSRWSQ